MVVIVFPVTEEMSTTKASPKKGKGEPQDRYDSLCEELQHCRTCIEVDYKDEISPLWNTNTGKYRVPCLRNDQVDTDEQHKTDLCECDKYFAEELGKIWDDKLFNKSLSYSGKNPEFDVEAVCVGKDLPYSTCVGDYPNRYPVATVTKPVAPTKPAATTTTTQPTTTTIPIVTKPVATTKPATTTTTTQATTTTKPELEKYQCICDNDRDEVTFHLPYKPHQISGADNSVYKIKAGNCTKDHIGDDKINYDAKTEILTVTIPMSRCQLKEYSDKMLYERSSNIYYSSTVEIQIGFKDKNGLVVVWDKSKYAIQCEAKRDYWVNFNYNVGGIQCKAGEKLVDGVCVWWGQTEAEFELVEYTDSSYTKLAPVGEEKISGNMIYLGINAKKPVHNAVWGVENCYVIDKYNCSRNAKEISEKKLKKCSEYLLFDPTGSKIKPEDKPYCYRGDLALKGEYAAGKDGKACEQAPFRFHYKVFMGTEEKSEYEIECKIQLCTPNGDNKELSNDGYCKKSMETCGTSYTC